ncbi:hypothetical protein ACFRMN_23895 [Streptomyces sp. NPDC056835]|uniref:hypothetical protein n=1 Tax=Streptomyces sp. NPDC056835 TaxID=3345956 RepID=UPI0036BF2456
MRRLLRRVFGHRERVEPTVPVGVHAVVLPTPTPTPEMWDALLTLARHHRRRRARGRVEGRRVWTG